MEFMFCTLLENIDEFKNNVNNSIKCLINKHMECDSERSASGWVCLRMSWLNG